MGFLTPLLFRNDSIHMLEEDPQAIQKIQQACLSNKVDSIGLSYWTKPPWWKFWKKPERRGGHSNPIESLGTRHADISRVIVVWGNSWVDLADEYWKRGFGYMDENTRTDETYINYLKSCMKIAKETVKQLETILKDKKDVSISRSKKNRKR